MEIDQNMILAVLKLASDKQVHVADDLSFIPDILLRHELLSHMDEESYITALKTYGGRGAVRVENFKILSKGFEFIENHKKKVND